MSRTWALVLLLAFAGIVGYHLLLPAIYTLRHRAVAWWRRPWTPALQFEDGIAIVPVRLSLKLFAEAYSDWKPLGNGFAIRFDPTLTGAYDLVWITAPPRPAASENAAVAAAIDLLHAVDELDDPPIVVAQAASQLREVIDPTAH